MHEPAPQHRALQLEPHPLAALGILLYLAQGESDEKRASRR